MKTLIATAAFGLESVVKQEVINLGYKDIKTFDGKVEFTPESIFKAIPHANLWLRSADRVLLKFGEFTSTTFDDLFEQTKALPWADLIPEDGKFTVTGKSVRSTLFSVPDVQGIVKKAVVEKMKQKYKINWFKETGAEFTIQASILKDVVTLTVDTTGVGNGLHKRGYRAVATRAPMKETMAAALIQLARFNGFKRGEALPFLDPCCGSGTLPIEAAMVAKNIAPGLAKNFVSEKWEQVLSWKEERQKAYAAMKVDNEPLIYAADIDPNAVELAKSNAELAGVDDCIIFENRAVHETILPSDFGVAIVNPPYGERLGQVKEAEALYAALGRIFNPTSWNVYVITPDEFFETAYKKRARSKRKLFNGMIKTDYYQYY